MLPLPTSFELVTVSPLDHPIRSLASVFPIVYFSHLSYQFLKNISTGSTIIISPRHLLSAFQVYSGKKKFPQSLSNYHGPTGTAFLGFILFVTAELLLIFIFKRIDYTF